MKSDEWNAGCKQTRFMSTNAIESNNSNAADDKKYQAIGHPLVEDHSCLPAYLGATFDLLITLFSTSVNNLRESTARARYFY